MAVHQPARQHGKPDLRIQKRRNRHRRGACIGVEQQHVSHRARQAHGEHARPHPRVTHRLPEERHAQRHQRGGDPAGVELRGGRALLARHHAAQHLVARARGQHAQRPQQRPGEGFASGPDDGERARQASHHQQPAQRAHRLVQPQSRHHRHAQRHRRHDGRELCQRQGREADEAEQAGHGEQRAAQGLEAGLCGAQRRTPRALQHKGCGQQRLEHVAHPQRHDDGHAHADQLARGVQQSKERAGHHSQRDACQRRTPAGRRAGRQRRAWGAHGVLRARSSSIASP